MAPPSDGEGFVRLVTQDVLGAPSTMLSISVTSSTLAAVATTCGRVPLPSQLG